MSVLSSYFNKNVDQCSPIQEDVQRIVQYDEDGAPMVSYVPVDYPTLQASLGSVLDWSLDALLKAGINPDFPVHTGIPTRIEGIGVVEDYKALAESILNEQNNVESNKE